MYLITNGRVITPCGILQGHDLLIDKDRIKWIGLKGKHKNNPSLEIIDAGGGFVSPGFIDIHTDYIEQMASPRPSALMDFGVALKETEKIVLNQGITTMFHSLSLYKADDFGNKAVRTLENTDKFANLIEESQKGQSLIRHKFHARLEIDNFEAVPYLKRYIDQGQVHLISFMDHTPGQGQYRNLEIYRTAIKDFRGLSNEGVEGVLKEHKSKKTLSFEELKEIADVAHAHGIPIASHDDDHPEKIGLVKGLGTTISEFPITLEVAKTAKSEGLYTVAGAPNILLGGSHSGNLCATTAIKEGTIDILCSDYYPASLMHGVFKLHEEQGYDLGEVMKLITINPAKAIGLDKELGSLETGKKADIAIIQYEKGQAPVITHTFVDGNLVSILNYQSMKASA
ncbi:MAG: phosphonate metabolism protein PhnM [Turicibacter sp.]|nr:phosphonate metabolism protein PhnM [Turicibacter sp.]